MAAPTLDVHAHVWLDDVEEIARAHRGYQESAELEKRRLGLRSAAVNAEQWAHLHALLTDVTARLTAMDSTGIDAQLVSVVPTQYHGWADRGLAAQLADATNAGVAAHCASAPDRLAGLGVVPLQHPDLAVAALESAVLAHGLKGVEISSHAVDPGGGTIELSDPRLEPLWRTACDLGAVVLLHPWGCTLDERLDRWYLANSVGQPVEHAVALSHLIFGGVLDRFPGLRFIATHGGAIYRPSRRGPITRGATGATPANASHRRVPTCVACGSTRSCTPRSPAPARPRRGRRPRPARVRFSVRHGEPDPLGALRTGGLDPAEVIAIASGNAADLQLMADKVHLVRKEQ